VINVLDNIFRLQTADTEYVFRRTKHGHLEHVYYGARLGLPDIEALVPARIRCTAWTPCALSGRA